MNFKTLCVLALATASTLTYAAEESDFNAVDIDADGFISMEEAQNVLGLTEIFAVADIDKDGKLSESEFSEVTQG